MPGLFGVVGIINGIIGLLFNDRGEYEADIRREKKKQLFAEQDKDSCTKNGDLTIAFRWRDNDSFSAIRVFENKNIITINNKEYMFDDIISCELSDNNSVLMAKTVTKISTGSMLGRAVVGGLLLGGVGAIVGGVTAKKETQPANNKQDLNAIYTLKVTINNLSEPVLIFPFRVASIKFIDSDGNDIAAMMCSIDGRPSIQANIDTVHKLASVICVIIDRNNKI